jgi:PAS domain S-box-containing protein
MKQLSLEKRDSGMKPQSTLNLILLDDDEDDYIILRDMLESIQRESYHLNWVPDPRQVFPLLKTRQWDAVLVDYDLGSSTGLDFIHTAMQSGRTPPIIMVTGRGSYELDREAMAAGASDYISKHDLNPPLLERTIRYAIERRQSMERLEAMVIERTQELQVTLEELNVMYEELQTENDQILLGQQQGVEELTLYRERNETFPSAYLVTDLHGRILQADYSAALLFGETAKSLVGRLLSSYVFVEDRSKFARSLVHVKPGNARQHFYFRLKPARRDPLDCCFNVYRLDKHGKEPVLRWLIHSY